MYAKLDNANAQWLEDYGFVDSISGGYDYFLPYMALFDSGNGANYGFNNFDSNYDAMTGSNYADWAYYFYDNGWNFYYSNAFCLLEMTLEDTWELLDNQYYDLSQNYYGNDIFDIASNYSSSERWHCIDMYYLTTTTVY